MRKLLMIFVVQPVVLATVFAAVLFLGTTLRAQDMTTLLSQFLVSLRAGSIAIPATAFASLGTPVDGTFKYCSDCLVQATCAGAGTGALAKRLAGAWVCN